jgi:hypothetical protein
MKRVILPIFLSLSLFFLLVPTVQAEDLTKNKFGIHITDIDEAEKASNLVNSSGGDWGYVTFTISSNDRKLDKWQDRMNVYNEKHLIPIVRLATFGNGNNWVKPSKDDPHDWAEFLNSLYWPTKKKIVMIGNEPNHGAEWEGQTNPQEYARFLHDTIGELKRLDQNFFVLNAGFDSSTPQQPPAYMDQVFFMDAMNKEIPGIFSELDGWSSHSYPNPGFSGKPTDLGRGTIADYAWELELLRTKFGVTKNLPVFITETGWIVKNSDHPSIRLDEDVAATYYQYAFEHIWLPDARVIAVTPFLLSYKEALFSHFSWLHPDNSETAFYGIIRGLPKQANAPTRDNKSVITRVSIPVEITQQNENIATVAFKNSGNSIWTQSDGYTLSRDDRDNLIKRNDFQIPSNTKVYPGQTHVFRFTLYSESILDKSSIGFQMVKGDEPFGEKLYVPIHIYKNPSLTVKVTNPSESDISSVQIMFIGAKDSDTINEAQIPTTGTIGTFKSKMFVPNQGISVKVSAPNRDAVIKGVMIQEGDNVISVTLPPEKPWWQRILSR